MWWPLHLPPAPQEGHVNSAEPGFRVFRVAGVLLLFTGLLAGVPALHGQTAPDPQSGEQQPTVRRFTFGGRLTVLGTGLIGRETSEFSQSKPVMTTTTSIHWAARRFGGGPSVQFNFSDRVALSADLLYRRAGYDATTVIYEGVDNTSTDNDERTMATIAEGTRADYWEVPLVARVYKRHRKPDLYRYWFFEGGAAMRHVSDIRSSRESYGSAGGTCCDETPAGRARATIMGIVVGGGLEYLDASGVKLMPEVRYTRWLGTTFDSVAARSKRDQLEVLLGFRF